ncbi:MAG: endonuclease/exonuclease/phosphatase family protein, partial [Bacteroidales bacterium]|nr:endonuclease/exonuclease/phosphatase family protein [Bacteroidales bacterium]
MKFSFLVILLLLVAFVTGFSQEKKEFEIVCVAFYNVENLFDTIDQPDVQDEEYLPTSANQWNSEKYFRKIERISTTLVKIGNEKTGDAPAVIGLCEIENSIVLTDLVNSEAMKPFNYQIVHFDSWYLRGMDVALLYRPGYFEPENSVTHRIYFRNGVTFQSRDHLLVSGKLLGEPVHFVVMHWPSRRGGEKRSRQLRIESAELALQITDSIRKLDNDAKIILFGDLNDDPFNYSIIKTLKVSNQRDIVSETNLYNPMYELYKKGVGSLAYRDSW